MAVSIGAGALAGVLTGGRLADRLIRRGRPSARVLAVAYLLAVGMFVPGLLTTSLAIAVLVLMMAAASLTAANPPLEAARRDVMHHRLWGRAESTRTFFRMGSEAIAPVTFGFAADRFASLGGGGVRGLQYALLIMLVPLLANAVILFRALRTHPRDVATATESERMTAPKAPGT